MGSVQGVGRQSPKRARAGSHRLLCFFVAALMSTGVAFFELRVHASTFTEHDSINLARALRHFDVRLHQPHSPGYPLVVLSAHGLHWLGSSLTAYLAFDLIASLAAIAATYWLARTMFGPRAGLIAGALLLATPLFLYYAEIVSVYPGEEAFAPLVALLAYRTALGADRSRSALLLLPTLALGAGFRPTILGLLLPVCLVGLIIGRPPLRVTLAGAAVAATIVLAWAIPVVVFSGGLHAYLQTSSEISNSSARTSLLQGATLRDAIDNVWLVVAGTFLTALPALLLVTVFARRLRRPDRTAVLILAGWIVPYVVFYSVGHFGKPGYLLAYVPALATAAAGLVSRARLGVPVSLALAATTLAVFLAVGHIPLPGPLARRALPPFVPTAALIGLQDRQARSLERMAHACPAATCTIVSLPGSPLVWDHSAAELQRWYATGSRIVSYDGDPQAVRHVEGDVLWVGTSIPQVIAQHARRVAAEASWQYLRSDRAMTGEILTRLGRD